MDQRDLDGSPLEPEDLTGDDPSISETPRAGVEEANTSPETIVDTHEGKVSDESSKISGYGFTSQDVNSGEQNLDGHANRSQQSASVPEGQDGPFSSGANRTTLDGEDLGSAATIEQLIQITKALQTDNEGLRRQVALSTSSTTQSRESTPTWADITSRGKSGHVMDTKNKNRTVSKLKQEISKQEEGDFTQIMRTAAKQHAGQGSTKLKNTVSIKQMSVMTIQMYSEMQLRVPNSLIRISGTLSLYFYFEHILSS